MGYSLNKSNYLNSTSILDLSVHKKTCTFSLECQNSISVCLMTFHSILSEFSSQALTIEMNLGFQVDHIIDLAGVKHAKVVLAVYNPNEKVG